MKSETFRFERGAEANPYEFADMLKRLGLQVEFTKETEDEIAFVATIEERS